jgi:hypothetical protein
MAFLITGMRLQPFLQSHPEKDMFWPICEALTLDFVELGLKNGGFRRIRPPHRDNPLFPSGDSASFPGHCA